MTRQVPIRLNVGSTLRHLGTLYRNPAEALKEHISNAIDEHLKAQAEGRALAYCDVVFTLTKQAITIEYPYAMDSREFETALHSVADSAKKSSNVPQIGSLGIGNFSFQQLGRKCIFFCKKSPEADTICVTLKEGADKAQFDSALKRDALERSGIRIQIKDLKLDPMKARGPLSPERLVHIFAKDFDSYLRKGWLRVRIQCGTREYNVAAAPINLARLAEGLEKVQVPGQARQTVGLNLYFDPSGKSVVSIRHMGVAVVEDIKTISAYGLEDSVYATGYVKGFIDADFLQPLPARTSFEDNRDWITFLDVLDKHRSQIEAEVETLQQEEREKTLSVIQRTAIEMAREILDSDEFRDLELPGGMTRKRLPSKEKRSVPSGHRTGERSKDLGDQKRTDGLRINYSEAPFDTGPAKHSRLLPGQVQANELNPDYKREMSGPDESKLAYATLMIGKEAIAYNDKSGSSDDHLERLLTFYFRVKERIAPHVAIPGKRGRGRPRKTV